MAIERTLSIIKPDAVAKNVIGKIYSRFETNGLKIVAAQMRQLSQAEAEGFYAVHRERPFFADLVKFMTSGPVMIQVLEGENAILKNRELMGATDPKRPLLLLRRRLHASIFSTSMRPVLRPGANRSARSLFVPGSLRAGCIVILSATLTR